MQAIKRREIKYLLNTLEFTKKKNEFEKILTKDPHNQENGYLVRSLYFDTLEDRDFHEKEAGVELRRKIRLRVSMEKNIKNIKRRCNGINKWAIWKPFKI